MLVSSNLIFSPIKFRQPEWRILGETEDKLLSLHRLFAPHRRKESSSNGKYELGFEVWQLWKKPKELEKSLSNFSPSLFWCYLGM